jgi:GNAT superfamily N-acetyltransferase
MQCVEDELHIGLVHISGWRDEMQALQQGYQRDEIKGHMPPINTDWDMMQKIEDSDMGLAIAATVGKQLLGFAIYLVFNHAHHKGVKFGSCDIIAVDPEYRGRGIAQAIIKHAEVVLRDHGVLYMTHGFRLVYNCKPLFAGLGFKAEEIMYIKQIGDV